MTTKSRTRKLAMSPFQTFGWPVKIRVRAGSIPLAPRNSPIFPAGYPFAGEVRIIRRAGPVRSVPPARQSFVSHDFRIIGEQDEGTDA
jgi:hypothetical protein